MNTNFENYLNDTESCIYAISRISRLLSSYFLSYYCEILKGKIEKHKLKEMISLCKTLQIISYFMFIEHNNAYKTIDNTYDNCPDYEYVMFDNVIV